MRGPRSTVPRLATVRHDVVIAPGVRIPHCAAVAGAIWLARFPEAETSFVETIAA